jgi:hypothetical protein
MEVPYRWIAHPGGCGLSDRLCHQSKRRVFHDCGRVAGSRVRCGGKKSTHFELRFEVAQVPGDQSAIDAQGGLAAVLHAAVTDPSRARLTIVYNGPKPDLMKDEAQAIITGHLGIDGVFYADELLLKCPTKYQEAVPQQVNGN